MTAVLLSFACVAQAAPEAKSYHDMAAETIDSIYKYYSVEGTELLSENYPFDANYVAGYLSQDTQVADNGKRPFAFLWPYSGTLSMTAAMLDATGKSRKYRKLLEEKVLPGLEQYFDSKRQPAAYASYVVAVDPHSGRFYDDNDWVGLDFIDLYATTGDKRFLRKAEIIWKFIEDGTDDKLGGGVYWSEDKHSKNTCSSAPAAVLAMKLYDATDDKKYLAAAQSIYEWTKANLQDKDDHLYFDNISRRGRVDRRKFAYNSGQMMQAAALLYKATGREDYLTDARNIAASSYDYFFHEFTPENGEPFRMLKGGSTWFHNIMFRGFIELYGVDKAEKKYIDAFAKNLSYIWEHGRSEEGLFSQDFSGRHREGRKWLLTQTAMAEMFARMAELTK